MCKNFKCFFILAVLALFMAGCNSAPSPPASPSGTVSSSPKGIPGEARVVHADDSTFEAEVLNDSGVVLVDFWADWCGPCKKQIPVIDALAPQMSNVKFVKVNVDKSRESATKYGVSSIPALFVFKNGKVVDKWTGYSDETKLRDKIEKQL